MDSIRIAGGQPPAYRAPSPAAQTASSQPAPEPALQAPAQAGEAAPPFSLPREGEEEVQSLHEMLQQARQKAEEQRERLKLPKDPSSYGQAAMDAYARLSRARNTAEVNSAAGYARRRISQLQSALRQDSDNAGRIKAAISQLQKAVTRAGKKRRDLEREKLLRARQLKAEREHLRREAVRQKQELQRRRALRSIREHGYIKEAEIDDRLQSQLSATQMELRAQAQALSETAAASVDAAVQGYAAQSAPAAAEVQVDCQA